MKNLYYIILSIIVVFTTSCEEKPDYPFSGGAQIYFDRSGGMGLCDSLVYSFAVRDNSTTEATLEIPVIVTGNVTDYDREINMEIVDTSTLEKNYTIGDIILPANKSKCIITINVKRTEDLKKCDRVIEFTLLPNKYFQTKMDTLWWDYKVKFNDILSKPDRWVYDYQPTFGAYSKVKYKFIIDVTDRWNFSKTGEDAVTDGELSYYLDKCKSALAKHKEEHGDLIDENGIKVTF